MFGLDLKKLFAAIVAAGVTVVVISFVGDLLVQPRKQKPAPVTVAAKEPAPPEKAPPKDAPPKEVQKADSVAALLASADIAAGKKVSKKCKSCHDMTAKKKNKIGPPLWDIVEAAKGGVGTYRYSSALKDMGGKWSYEDLDAFMASPKGFMKGTKMAFPGIKKAKDRANLIAFLRSLSESPRPLP